MKKSVLVIVNPVSGSFSTEKIEKAKRHLINDGFSVEMFFTKKKGDAELRAQDALREKPSMILVAGGDGSINEVANSVAFSGMVIGLLPLGTTNVLANEIGIAGNIEKALHLIKKGKAEDVSLGRISSKGRGEMRYFILMAGIGFDGSTVYGINNTIKSFAGKGAYIFSGIKEAVLYCPYKLNLTVNEENHEGYSAIIGNTSCYGGSFKVTPDASLKKPDLYICIFRGHTRFSLIKYLFGIILKHHLRFTDIVYRKCRKVVVEGMAHIQIDGDYFGKTPVQIDIADNALKLLM